MEVYTGEKKLNKNILNWYPFKENSFILEIKGDVDSLEIDQFPQLSKVKVETIDNISQIQENKKFDYIVMIGCIGRIKEITGENLKLDQTIKMLEKYLKPDGRFLIAVDNKFGLKYFSGAKEEILNRKFESLIGYNNEPEKIETFTKSRLERKLKEIGYNTSFYYPLPDYRVPNVIFSDRQLPSYTDVDKYSPYTKEEASTIFNEIDVFREILKTDKNMFTFFTNSFLVEATKSTCDTEFKYISFNNLRKEKYQLITKIADEYVEKQVISEVANEHYENIKKNIKYLEDNEIGQVDFIENNLVKSKYIDQKYLMNNILAESLEKGDRKKFDELLEKYIEIISKNSYKETDYSKTVFAKYNIEIEDKSIIEDLHFLKNGLWDMTFKNCFIVDEDKFLFFDQEWNKPELPYEYILYRSIFYTISLRRFLKIEDLFDKYNLTKYLNLFQQLDSKMQEEIRDEEAWKFFGINSFFDIEATKQEIINLNIRSKAQQGAIDNLQKENKELRTEYEKLQKYKEEIENRFTEKIYKKIKRLGKKKLK